MVPRMKKPAKVSPKTATKPIKVAAPKTPKTHRSLCPINLTLESVGDSWSMLIIRDLMLRGHNSYQGFLRSPPVTSDVLKSLVEKSLNR